MGKSAANRRLDSLNPAAFIGVLVEGQTYKNLLYLLLAFPLGIAYYVLLVTGFALGVGLAIVLVGLGILIATVIGLRFVAAFERTLANRLLGTEIVAPDDVEREGAGIVDTVKAYIRAPSTWRGLGFIFLKFWLGILSFVLILVFLGTAIELVSAPLFPDGLLNIEVAGWEVASTVDTTAEQAIAVPAGLLLGLISLHLLNAFAGVNGSIASSLLGPSRSTNTQQQTTPDN